MNDNIRRYAIALGVGIACALAQRIRFHDPAIEVARDVSVACAQAREPGTCISGRHSVAG